MASTQILLTTANVQLEDPLAYLPRSLVTEFRKGELIYGEAQPLAHLYLMLSGSVMVSRHTTAERYTIIEIYRPDELFGEAVLIGSPRSSEQARAVETVTVMSWTKAEIEQIISREPRLALALIQGAVQRSLGLARRIESLCTENVQQRLVRLLLHETHRTGTPELSGCIRLKPMTHSLISRYLGTTREIVSVTMNRLKRLGCIRYSTSAIIIDHRSLETLDSPEYGKIRSQALRA